MATRARQLESVESNRFFFALRVVIFPRCREESSFRSTKKMQLVLLGAKTQMRAFEKLLHEMIHPVALS